MRKDGEKGSLQLLALILGTQLVEYLCNQNIVGKITQTGRHMLPSTQKTWPKKEKQNKSELTNVSAGDG